MIVPNNVFDDDFPSLPHIPNIAPSISPEPDSAEENSAESDQPDDTFASADDNLNSHDSTNDSTSDDNLFSPTKSSSKPNISSPEANFNNNLTKSASSSRLTRQQAKSQNISVPDPISQPHTLEFLTRKKQKEEASKPFSSAKGSTSSKVSLEEKEKRKKAELAKVDKAIEKETAAHRLKRAAIERQAATAKRWADLEAVRLARFKKKKRQKQIS